MKSVVDRQDQGKIKETISYSFARDLSVVPLWSLLLGNPVSLGCTERFMLETEHISKVTW